MIKVLLCKSFESATEASLLMENIVSVEAEYGDKTLTTDYGNVVECFCHHGKNAGNPAPSVRWDVQKNIKMGYNNFIISHIDADTIMGILWASKILLPTKISKELGKLIEIQDLNGFHYMEENYLKPKKLDPEIEERFLGIGYIINKFQIDLSGSSTEIIDISKEFHKLCLRVKDIIISGLTDYTKEKIYNWIHTKSDNIVKSLVLYNDKVNLYFAEHQLCSAYKRSDNTLSDINICFNLLSKTISLSVINTEKAIEYFGEEGVPGVLKKFFNDIQAGGRLSIGGTSRNKKYTHNDAYSLYKYISALINVKKYDKIITHKII